MIHDWNEPASDLNAKQALECFVDAGQAIQNQKWKRAIELCAAAVNLAPDNVLYRQLLRAVERRIYNNNKTGSCFALPRIATLRSRINEARECRNWVDLDRAAEEGLQLNPWDSQFNADLGDAARECAFLSIAQFAYETAVSPDGAPDNQAFLTTFASIYEETANDYAAMKTLQKVLRQDPFNQTIQDKIESLPLSSIAESCRYDERRAARRKSIQEVHPIDRMEVAQLQQKLCEDPTNLADCLRMAEHDRRAGMLEDAVNVLRQGFDVTGELNVYERMEDVELEQLRRDLILTAEILAEEFATQDDDGKSRAAFNESTQKLLNQEIEVFVRRVKRYPHDLRLKDDLGTRFMRKKEFGRAIPLLQSASKDIRLEVRALTRLGHCFLAQKQNKLAQQQFDKAREKSIDDTDPNDWFLSNN